MASVIVKYINWSEGDCPDVWMDWMRQELGRLGARFEICRCRTRAELAAGAADADIVTLGGHDHVLTDENLDVLPRLAAIVKMGSGVNDLDIPAATRRGIVVVNTPQGVTDTVSDHAIALIFALLRAIPYQDRLMRAGTYDKWAAPDVLHFRGLQLGLVGFGRIPQVMSQKLAGFCMDISAHDPYVSLDTAARLGVRLTSLREVMSSSMVVSVHAPLSEATYHMIGAREIGWMRPAARLINTSRGQVVDEAALYDALVEGRIAGAALDVLESEPPDPASPLLQLPNVINTPHMASLSDAFPGDLWKAIFAAIADLIAGRWPASSVNRREVQPKWELR